MVGIESEVGLKPVKNSSLGSVVDLLLTESIRAELACNWNGAYESLPATSVLREENLVRSNIDIKVKDDSIGGQMMKARLFLQGNRNYDI